MLNMTKLFQKIKENPDMIIKGFSEQNEKEEFLLNLRKYIIFEYKDKIFKIIQNDKKIMIESYTPINPYKMIQHKELYLVENIKEINQYIQLTLKENKKMGWYKDDIIPELSTTYGGKSVLYILQNEISGNLEKEVLNHLKHIEMVRNSGGYKVLRFWHYNGKDWFDFEVNSLRITG